MTQKLIVNGQTYELDVPPDMPLLWVIRDVIGLTGTKFGCGIAACGACTVHLDGIAVRSCALPVGNVSGKVTTIEGLSAKGDHPVQKAWLKTHGAAVRLLSERADDAGRVAAQHEPEADGRGYRWRHGGQHLPVRNLYPDSRRNQRSRGGEVVITIENLSRRSFLKGAAALGGSFALGLILDPFKPHPFYGSFIGSAEAAEGVAPAPGSLSPNVFVSIDNTGTVTIIAHRSEMGQGVRTSVPMILADELEADWSRVKIEQAVGDKIYGNQYTDGSRSVRHNYERMREFGAVTRTMLVQAAAQQWGVPASECKAQNHKVIHVPSGKSLDYGQLVDTAAALPVPTAKSVTLKDPKDFRYIGKPISSVDFPNMMVGKAIYGIDVKMPGMMYAVVEHCPVTYGKVKSFDPSEALKVPGVKKVVEIPQNQPPIVFNTLGGIAVIATNTWAANEGRKKLKIEWDYGANVVYDSDAFRKDMEDENTKRWQGRAQRGRCEGRAGRRDEGGGGGLLRSPLRACDHGAAVGRRSGEGREV